MQPGIAALLDIHVVYLKVTVTMIMNVLEIFYVEQTTVLTYFHQKLIAAMTLMMQHIVRWEDFKWSRCPEL